MYLAHSLVLRLMTLGLTGTAQFFVAMACRPWLAYVTFAAEALGGSLLILGVQTRWIAIALTPALLGAIIRGARRQRLGAYALAPSTANLHPSSAAT